MHACSAFVCLCLFSSDCCTVSSPQRPYYSCGEGVSTEEGLHGDEEDLEGVAGVTDDGEEMV